MSSQPPKWLKLLFWLILGALSTFFAEVVAGSDPFPYFHPWGILLVCPLYTLRILCWHRSCSVMASRTFPPCLSPGRSLACRRPMSPM